MMNTPLVRIASFSSTWLLVRITCRVRRSRGHFHWRQFLPLPKFVLEECCGMPYASGSQSTGRGQHSRAGIQ
jgi:hypothetical protein